MPGMHGYKGGGKVKKGYKKGGKVMGGAGGGKGRMQKAAMAKKGSKKMPKGMKR